jgi:hypothetical protein
VEEQILNELKELKSILTHIVGTSDLSKEVQISQENLDKAAKAFKKLSIERNEWIEESAISKIIKNAPYQSGKFIQKEFGFTNCFKYGRSIYYNRSDLVTLARELKERNIDFNRFFEYRAGQEKFEKSVEATRNKLSRKSFKIPDDLSDITTSRVLPDITLIQDDIKRLKQEFKEEKLADHIDIYQKNYAMVKFEYRFEKYLDQAIKRRCSKWCEHFNYAQSALIEVRLALKD